MKHKVTKIVFFSLLSLLISGCGTLPKKSYTIGIDPMFFPLDLNGETINVLAFTTELLEAIAKKKHIKFRIINMSWDNLIEGLCECKYDGALSFLYPTLINQTKYRFSCSYLPIGPVLVTPKSVEKRSFNDLKGKLIAIQKSPFDIELMTQNPDIAITFYVRIVTTLESVARGEIQGALIPVLSAHSYLRDLFQDSLMISSDVLTDQGLRMVTPLNKESDLCELFNEGLKELKQEGLYEELLHRWNIL